MTDTLEDWLETNIRYAEETAPTVKSGGDLPPVVAAVKDGQVIGASALLWRSIAEKNRMVDLFRAYLKSVEADRYALISMAWGIRLPNDANVAEAERVIGTQGSTGTKYEAGRTEVVNVVVGDRTRSLSCTLDVTRDYKGKIRKLTRQPTRSSLDAAIGMHGQMIDLLLDNTVH